MNELNSVLIEGTLLDEPKRILLAETEESVRLVKFDIASNRYYMDRKGEKAKETVFISVQCWGELGEKCISILKKGMKVRTVGRLRLCRWVSNDGSTRRTIEIVANHLEFRRSKAGSTQAETEILEDSTNEAEQTSEAEVFYAF